MFWKLARSGLQPAALYREYRETPDCLVQQRLIVITVSVSLSSEKTNCWSLCQVLTKDSVTVSVDAVVYYRVSNATVSVANVENAHHSTR